MKKIAQAYLAFDRDLTESDLHRIAEYVFATTESAVAEYFPEVSVRVVAKVEEGSAKTWATLTAVASAIVFYGDLRSSIDLI